MYSQKVIDFIQAALECSLFICPTDPGLFYDEVIEAGRRANFGAGEIADNIQNVGVPFMGRHKITLSPVRVATIDMFIFVEEPDFRNIEAFDFVFSEMNARIKTDGAREAQLDHTVLVERGASKGVPSHDIEVAIAILLATGKFTEKNGVLRPKTMAVYEPLPGEQRRQATGGVHHRKSRALAYPIVKDIIERRSDGRPTHIEPLDAFAEVLGKVGHASFRLWWKQTVSELRQLDPNICPVSILVLSAALVEASLTFVVKYARERNLAVFKSTDFDREPRYWKLENLIGSATTGGSDAVLDASTRLRAESLTLSRQRIHAGRMLTDHPSGPPDLRPEEAREAKVTAELVARRVLDWLTAHS